MKEFFIRIFGAFWTKCLRNFWSMIRWCKLRKEVSEPVVKVDESNLKSTINDVYAHFKWTMDDWTQLFDSMKPAPHLYNEYLTMKETPEDDRVLGDCDDFHTIVYHILKNNGYDVALITVVTDPIKESHTMCVIKDTGKDGKVSYRVVDYTRVKGPFESIEEFIDGYYPTVCYWCLDRYDYEKNRFRGISKKDF